MDSRKFSKVHPSAEVIQVSSPFVSKNWDQSKNLFFRMESGSPSQLSSEKLNWHKRVHQLLRYWWNQYTHIYGVTFTLPETELYYSYYANRLETPIQQYLVGYIFLITLVLMISHSIIVFQDSFNVTNCLREGHCRRSFYAVVLYPPIMFIIGTIQFIVLCVSKRKRWWITFTKMLTFLAFYTVLMGSRDIIENDFISLILHLSIWSGIVVHLLGPTWILLFILAIIGFEAIHFLKPGKRTELHLFPLITASIHMIIQVATNLIWLRRRREVFKNVENSVFYIVQKEMEEEKQDNVLHSILPMHVAQSIKQNAVSKNKFMGRFRELYISKYHNVSILFADIKGFTAMASRVTANQLASTLNELFGRFDILAEEYSCLRIKLLGDCYFCVCGLPEPQKDHSRLCVDMGLQMMEVVESVNDSLGTQLAMRVGVHTGTVLCGVIGQHKWQFDVWSDDVTMANNLESGGLPGHVHISEDVLKLLGNAYKVLPGQGYKRNSYISEKGIKTYLICNENIHPSAENRNRLFPDPGRRSASSVISSGSIQLLRNHSGVNDELVPLANNTNMGVKKRTLNQELLQKVSQDTKKGMEFFKIKSISNIEREIDELSPCIEKNHFVMEAINKNDKWKKLAFQVLKEEAKRSGNWMTDKKFKKWSLQIRDLHMEAQFLKLPSYWFDVFLFLLLIVHTTMYLATQVILPQRHLSHILFWSTLIVFLYIFLCYLSTKGVKKLQFSLFLYLGRKIRQERPWRHGTILLIWILLMLAHSLPLEDCSQDNPITLPCQPQSVSSSNCDYAILTLVVLDVIITFICLATTDLTLIAVVLINIIGKIFIFVLLPYSYLAIIYAPVRILVYPHYEQGIPVLGRLMAHHFYLAVASLVWLIFYWRQHQYQRRVLFMQGKGLELRKQEIDSSQIRSQALLLNIIPAYVLEHYLKENCEINELYCKDHENVGVMFAAIQGFDDFYSEDEVNNQGLECLRLLNEIFSDFDELFLSQNFPALEKIKTIGPTYMVASGLVATEDQFTSAHKVMRWTHLKELVELAFAMINTLTSINKDSFQNFRLRIGIHQGPLVAGVIGAKKPQFDIWGDTVNMASRLESTGSPGKIQVTEGTKKALELFGYDFEYRGPVTMKGKGQVITYFMTRKGK